MNEDLEGTSEDIVQPEIDPAPGEATSADDVPAEEPAADEPTDDTIFYTLTGDEGEDVSDGDQDSGPDGEGAPVEDGPVEESDPGEPSDEEIAYFEDEGGGGPGDEEEPESSGEEPPAEEIFSEEPVPGDPSDEVIADFEDESGEVPGGEEEPESSGEEAPADEVIDEEPAPEEPSKDVLIDTVDGAEGEGTPKDGGPDEWMYTTTVVYGSHADRGSPNDDVLLADGHILQTLAGADGPLAFERADAASFPTASDLMMVVRADMLDNLWAGADFA